MKRVFQEDGRAVLAAELLKRWGLEPLREHGGGVHGAVVFALDLAGEFYKEVEARGWEAEIAS